MYGDVNEGAERSARRALNVQRAPTCPEGTECAEGADMPGER